MERDPLPSVGGVAVLGPPPPPGFAAETPGPGQSDLGETLGEKWAKPWQGPREARPWLAPEPEHRSHDFCEVIVWMDRILQRL